MSGTVPDPDPVVILNAAAMIYAGYNNPRSSPETRQQAVYEAWDLWRLVTDHPELKTRTRL